MRYCRYEQLSTAPLCTSGPKLLHTPSRHSVAIRMRRACVRVETTLRNVLEVLFVLGSVRRFKSLRPRRGTPRDGGRGPRYRVGRGWGGGVRIMTVPQRAQPALFLAVGLPRRASPPSSCTRMRTQHPLISFTEIPSRYIPQLGSPFQTSRTKGPAMTPD
jgi:hypothetical protein